MKSCPLLLLAAQLAAHDLYLMPEWFRAAPGERLVVAIHNGDAFPDSEGPPVLARLIAGSVEKPLRDLRVVGKRGLAEVTVDSGANWLVVRTLPNFLSLKGPEFLGYLKEEGLTQIQHDASRPSRELYSKYAKSLVVGGTLGSFSVRPLLLAIEMIPEADPTHTGRVPILVLLDGEPAPGLQVESAFAPPHGKTVVRVIGRTDSSGRILVAIDSPGKWRLHTVAMRPASDRAKADWESLWASFTFEVQ